MIKPDKVAHSMLNFQLDKEFFKTFPFVGFQIITIIALIITNYDDNSIQTPSRPPS
jgi:hypothetical protein